MTPEFAIQTAKDAMYISLLVVAPPVGISLIIGLLISVFQTVTQISESTLTIVPKIIAVFGSIIVFGPFMLDTLIKFTVNIFKNLPDYVR